MKSFRNQCGSTLLVALVMLVMLTLIAISAMSTTTTSIQIVGNAQFREEALAAGQRAIEVVLSSANFRDATPAPQSIDINLDGVADYTVTFDAPSCQAAVSIEFVDPPPVVPSDCETSGMAICYWTTWDIVARVSDIATGANLVIHQGVSTVAGASAAATYCNT